jgi:hypothetical protein
MKPSTNPAIGSDVARSVDEAAIGARDAINSVADATRPAVERIASGAHTVVDKVADVATQAVATLDAKNELLKSAQERLVGGTRGYLREHPIALLGIVFAAGFIASRLTVSK